jgi:hypothetical protein
VSVAAWSEVLDRLDADLDRYEAVAAGDDAAVPPAFEPPAGLGPLPASLTDRAVAVLGRMAEAETLLVNRRDGLAREQSVNRKVRGTRPERPPHFIDRTA